MKAVARWYRGGLAVCPADTDNAASLKGSHVIAVHLRCASCDPVMQGHASRSGRLPIVLVKSWYVGVGGRGVWGAPLGYGDKRQDSQPRETVSSTARSAAIRDELILPILRRAITGSVITPVPRSDAQDVRELLVRTVSLWSGQSNLGSLACNWDPSCLVECRSISTIAGSFAPLPSNPVPYNPTD